MTELTCRDVAGFLMDYVDGALQADQQRAFEAHVAECDDCVVYMRQYEQSIALGRAGFGLDEPASQHVPEALVEAILAARRARR